MIKPRALKKGETIGLVAPSGPIPEPEIVDSAVAKVQELGFNAKVGKSCRETYGYLAGSDDLRANDLNAMFADPVISGIICVRGGYGAPRILDKLDYRTIARNPKVFVGYSDITSLHVAFNKMCDLVTFHGPMVTTDMLTDFDDFSKDSFLKAITTSESLDMVANPPGEPIKCLTRGKASGPIVGGNLSLISALMGTPYEIDTKDKLLLLEDIDEYPYRVDRMLTQLRLAGKFAQCSGVIIGDWNHCVPEEGKPSLSLMDLFEGIIAPFGKPAIYNLKAGHCRPKMTVPFGVEAILDADNCTLSIKESAAEPSI
ncbi:putative murein peptide carboxypeptidase [Peptococcaceae bacterium CEB3]|nr:putative murein peptide carboxypeptidase [Peptococcaceae bacterium CEB3]